MYSCSIIICTRNRAESLMRTIESLGQIDVPPTFSVEIVVVDNGSSDDTAMQVKSATVPAMSVRYLSEPRQGQCYARNAGLAASKGQIIIFLDDDIVPPRNWLAAMCGPIVRGEADAVAGGISIAPELQRPWMELMHRSWLASTERLDSHCPATLVGGNMAFSRTVLERVPGFDTELGPGRLGFGDDTLFGEQLRAAGYRVAHAFHAPVEHHFDPDRLTRASLLSAARKHGKTEAYLDRHWRHRVERWPRLKVVWAGIRLMLWRARRPGQWLRKDGAAAAEMYYVLNLYRLRQYILESCRPALYEPGGLVKGAPTASQVDAPRATAGSIL